MGSERKVVLLLSGGLDSTVLAYHLRAVGWQVHALSVRYGQRHAANELAMATRTADKVCEHHDVVDLRPVGALLTGNVLTGDGDVPHGHYAEASMRKTVVPMRNPLMLAVAFAVAADRGAMAVATAVHGGDHHVYPDCRPAFAALYNRMARAALDGIAAPTLMVPFMGLSKADIVAEGGALRVPFDDTWSCYDDGPVHCGQCGTCMERQEAFRVARVPDPSMYRQPWSFEGQTPNG